MSSDIECQQVVDRQPVLAHEVADAAAGRQTAITGGRGVWLYWLDRERQ